MSKGGQISQGEALNRLKLIGIGELPSPGLKRLDTLGSAAVRVCGCDGQLPDMSLFTVIEES